MTVVRLDFTVPQIDGVAVPTLNGYWLFAPSRLLIDDESAQALLPDPFVAELEDGVVEVDFEPSGIDWCWIGQPLGMVGLDDDRYFAVPVVAPGADPLPFYGPDVPDVDPKTLDPPTPVIPAYKALIDAAQESADAAGGVAASAKAAVDAHEADHTNPHNVTAAQVGAPTTAQQAQAIAGEASARTDGDTAITNALGFKADLVGGHVPATQLPSYVDDVLPFANIAAFPAVGEDGKIYVAEDTNLTYRWSGSAYGVLDPSLALGETSATAFAGDRGKTAYDHSQTTGNPHGVTAAQVGAPTTAQQASAIAAESTARDAAIADAVGALANVARTGSASDITGGTLPTSVIPALSIIDTYPVASQAAMLALTAQKGDVAVRSDTGKTYILSTNSPTTLADWVEMAAVGKVASVNGQQGPVVLGKGDIGLSHADDTSDNTKPVSAPQATAIGLKADRGLPSYIPNTVTGIFDPKLNAYNFKNTNTRKMRAGSARAMAGGLFETLVLGDSGGAGCTNGTTLAFDRLRAWPISARDELARHGVPVGGTGLVRITDNSTSQDARWGSTGVWNSSGKWYAFTAALNATATFTTNLAGDHVGLLYYDTGDGATFTISVNGASSGAGFTTITNSGSPVGLKMAVLTTPIAAGQTVVMKKTSTPGLMDLVAAQVWNAAAGGMVVHNMSQSSSKASGTGAGSWVDVSATTALGVLTNTPGRLSTDGTQTPDVVIVALGGNDHPATDTPIATIIAAITTLRTRYATSDFLIVIENQVNDTVVTAANWEAYAAALYALADTLDVPLVDFRARVGNYATTVANGICTDSLGHLTAGAWADLGRNLGMVLAA